MDEESREGKYSRLFTDVQWLLVHAVQERLGYQRMRGEMGSCGKAILEHPTLITKLPNS